MQGFIKFNKGVLRTSWPVKIWLLLLVAANAVTPLFFLQRVGRVAGVDRREPPDFATLGATAGWHCKLTKGVPLYAANRNFG